MDPELLFRRSWAADALLTAHPPKLRHPLKRRVYAEITATPPAGEVEVTRWKATGLPEALRVGPCEVTIRPGVYDYRPGPGAVWHVNFADPLLFVAYGSALLAQDELQVLEHPALGSVREALLAEGLPALTEDASGPTPVLVRGVERRCALDTAPRPTSPLGLYGNAFARASEEEVLAALTVLRPPTVTNLIAMAAPGGGRGAYREGQIAIILRTACAAFRAAVLESGDGDEPIEVCTGFWGCGAFGGNRPLMVLLQLLAARLTAVDRLVFHTVTPDGVRDVEAGLALAEPVLAEGSLSAMISRIAALDLQWGTSDGN